MQPALVRVRGAGRLDDQADGDRAAQLAGAVDRAGGVGVGPQQPPARDGPPAGRRGSAAMIALRR
jgi:hypothetical protein